MRRRRVLIVEDDVFVSDALAELLTKLADVELLGSATTLRLAQRILVEQAPDIVIADLFLEDGNSLELLREVRARRLGTRLIVLTGARDVFAASEAIAAGAMGYVLKAQPMRELVEAVRCVLAGRSYVSPRISQRLPAGSSESGGRTGLEKLSRRELEVLRFVVAGQTSVEIAGRLCVSPKTIDAHRSNMYRKLSLRNAVELSRFASVHGIGPPERSIDRGGATVVDGEGE